MTHSIKVGIGGWTFEPWRGVFYPLDLPQARELEYASRTLTSIEINGTYYSSFKPATWQKWRESTPEGFVFSVKASRYCTNRKVLADAGPSIDRFLGQGLSELDDKLGPINWQFMATKTFDEADFAAFLALLPRAVDGLPLRHAVEVRHPSFATPAFYDLARRHGVAIVAAQGEDVPEIDEPTAPFTYARFMTAREDLEAGHSTKDFKNLLARVRRWQASGDVFAYFISAAKVRNPAAATTLLRMLA